MMVVAVVVVESVRCFPDQPTWHRIFRKRLLSVCIHECKDPGYMIPLSLLPLPRLTVPHQEIIGLSGKYSRCMQRRRIRQRYKYALAAIADGRSHNLSLTCWR